MYRIFLIITTFFLLVGLGDQSFAQSEKLVTLETNLGDIVIEFFPDDAPNHVDNFIGLTESGFYDGTIFHRIIPGFMIQGGDPNTVNGDPNTWGTGGPDERVNAEFNSIKHNRGIVSMARSADPNSGGSQFFIVHKDSNFLDGQYTAFGRIVTDESFETLDKIAAVKTRTGDKPEDAEQVKVTKALVVERFIVSNILELQEPERTQAAIMPPLSPPAGNQEFESDELGISFSVPEGWQLEQQPKTQPNSPDIVMFGPLVGSRPPAFLLTIQDTNQLTFDEIVSQELETVESLIKESGLEILSKKEARINEKDAYVINAQQIDSPNSEIPPAKFQEVLIYDTEKYYTFLYSNTPDDFDAQLLKFEEMLDSFQIVTKDTSMTESSEDDEGGGCLIASAAFGSELAPQIQQLREIRDNTILSTNSGIAFMTGFNQLYYSFSPTIADLEREYPIFKEMVKVAITPLLSSLFIMEYADSESKVLGYGAGVILLNIGMYFVAPAAIIYKIRKQAIS